MRKNMNTFVAVFTLILATSIPTQSFGAPVSSPGKTSGNGPCATSGITNSQTQSIKNPNKSCYEVGPGGGIIFYYSEAGFSEPGATCDPSCHYLEYAPAGWYTGGVPSTDPILQWSATPNALANASGIVIGTGLANTAAMYTQDQTSGYAGTAARSYSGSDSSAGQWFLPSKNELYELCKYVNGEPTGPGTGNCTPGNWNTSLTVSGGFHIGPYSSSTEISAGYQLIITSFGGVLDFVNFATRKDIGQFIRPIRAF